MKTKTKLCTLCGISKLQCKYLEPLINPLLATTVVLPLNSLQRTKSRCGMSGIDTDTSVHLDVEFMFKLNSAAKRQIQLYF